MAPIDDYSGPILNGVLQAVRTMTWTDAQRVQKVVAAAASKPEAERGDIALAISAISPELGAVVRQFKGKAATGVALVVVLFVLSKCQFSVNIDIDVNELIQHLNQPPATASQSLDETNQKKPESDTKPSGGGPGDERYDT